jgi:heme oxygenase (mycobilin-producing)
MTITVCVDMEFKPEEIDDVVAGLAAMLPDTRAFDGCLSVHTVQRADDPSHIRLIERWESRAAQERYAAWRAQSPNGLADAFVTPPAFTYFDELPDV